MEPSAALIRRRGRWAWPSAISVLSRFDLHKGNDGTPVGPFGGATCLLILHFVPEDERRRTLAEVHRRLRTGAPFVIAHHSFPQDGKEKAKWLGPICRLCVGGGTPAANAESAIAAISERLPGLPPPSRTTGCRNCRRRLVLRGLHVQRLLPTGRDRQCPLSSRVILASRMSVKHPISRLANFENS
jgi:hypothetical protein